MPDYTYPFSELNQSRVEDVGGKNASLGEMFQELSSEGIRVPDGFATTADAYWKFINANDLKTPISEQLEKLDREEYSNLKEVGENIRSKIIAASMPDELSKAIKAAYQNLEEREENLESVAIRSSATAEDLPEASFAGQH